jgi:hypothetical protein
MPALVYSSTNNFSSVQTEGGGATTGVRLGICAALSALWCKSVFQGTRPLLTKPETGRAQLLQVKYRWNPATPGSDYVDLFKWIDVTAVIDFTLGVNLALAAMAAKPGVYHLSEIGVHTVAASTLGQMFYFYDCDENGAGGLYEFSTMAEWKDLINQYYAGVRWLALRVTAA